MMISDSKKITYVFKKGRSERWLKETKFPTEFLYGFPELASQGWDVDFLEDIDIGIGPPLSFLGRFLNKFSRFFGDLPIGMMSSLLLKKNRETLPTSGLIVATTNGIGLALAFGRLLGFIQVPVVLLAMGVLPLHFSIWQKWLLLTLLNQLELLTISRAEQKFLQEIMPDREIGYIPFGVDQRFWFPNPEPTHVDNYVLAIGNDRNRDWKTLVSAWSEDLPNLKIITSLPVVSDLENIEVIRGDWRSSMLSDEEIRELYWGAMFVVVPSRETVQPAGQSVSLQAMACGKPVILSNISGLWDKELMKDGENCLLVQPHDVLSLKNAIYSLLNNVSIRQTISARARDRILFSFNVNSMADNLAQFFSKLR